MASFKLTFLCSVLLMSLHAQAAPQNAIQPVEDTDLLDLLKQLVKAIEQILDRVIADGETIINNITDDSWEGFRTNTVNVTAHALGVALDRILKDIDSMAAQSTTAAKKLSGCISSSRQDILDVPVGFWDANSKCFASDLLALVKTLGPLITDLEGVQANAKKVVAKLDDCKGNDLSALLCVAQVAGELLGVVTTIPEAISSDLPVVVDNVKTLVQTALQCGKDEAPNYFVNAGKVLDKVATCAAK